MKTIAYILLISMAFGCGNNTKNQPKQEAAPATAVVAETDEQTGDLLGKITFEDLQAPPFDSWFIPAYEAYEPAEESLTEIKDNVNRYDIEIFMGTWCQDSQREVPLFFRMLEESGYDTSRVKMYGVDEYKMLPKNMKVATEFQMVPTIIFYENGKEVNRFVEFPQESFEKDIANIVSGREYKNSYAE